MKNLSPELLQKYAKIILEVQIRGYPVNQENIKKVAIETGKEAILREVEAVLGKDAILKKVVTEFSQAKAPKIYDQQAAHKEANGIAIKVFIGIGVFLAIIFASILYSSAIVKVPKRHSIVFYDALTSAQGTIIWLIYANYNKSPTINLIDGQNKKLIKEITTDIISPRAYIINNNVYLFDEKSHFEARNSYTGEVFLNNELLSKQLPQLASGIGTVKYNSDWLDIVTKKGEIFCYYLVTNKLYNTVEKNNLLEQYQKTPFTKFSWVISPNNTEMKSLMLTSKNANSYNENAYTSKNVHSISESDWGKLKRNEQIYNNEKLIFSPEKTFLSAGILYADSLYCVIRHQTEIGDNAKPIFSCVGVKEKKILWEIQNIDPKQSALLTYLDKNYITSLSCGRYNNLLNISTKTCQVEGKESRNPFYSVSCQIDIKTGKILWECAPTY